MHGGNLKLINVWHLNPTVAADGWSYLHFKCKDLQWSKTTFSLAFCKKCI